MSPDHLDQLGQQLKLDKSAACRRAIERILAMIKKRCDEGVYQDPIQAELDCRGTGHLPEIEKCFGDSRPQNGQGKP